MNFSAAPQFIRNEQGGYDLFIVDYVPVESPSNTFIILNPLGSECNVIDAMLANLARHLASTGRRVVRFDYFGTRDSDGDFGQITLETLMSDVETIIDFINKSGNSVSRRGFIGVRFGALLAMQVAEKKNDFIDDLILCAPISSATDFFAAELMQALSMQTVLFKKIVWDRKKIIHELIDGNTTVIDGYNLANMNGYPLTKSLYLSILDLDQQLSAESTFSKKCLIVTIDSRKRKTYKKIDVLKERFVSADVDCIELIAGQGLPWIHGKTLQKVYSSLNEEISTWIDHDG